MARILLIDDQDELRMAIRVQLERLGHQVIEAPDGKVGLERFHAESPDLVITDLVMPVMEGIETIRRLRQANPTLGIIAISGGGGNPASAYLRVAKAFGADQMLAKPFSPEELKLAVQAVLQRDIADALTFLVLDDNAETRYLNRALLESEFPNSVVMESRTVEEALASSKGHRLDAVITDHHLGESNGGEFVASLRARGALCPILMVTGSSDPKVHARAMAAGASRVFFGTETDFTGYLRDQLKSS
jgi:CheY-like chemotaxis protein